MSEIYSVMLPGSAEDQDPSMWELSKEDVPIAMEMLKRAGADIDAPNISEALGSIGVSEFYLEGQ